MNSPTPQPQNLQKSGRVPASSTADRQVVDTAPDRPTCSATTKAGTPCRAPGASGSPPLCGPHRMSPEERRQAGLLGSLALTRRIRQEQATVVAAEAQDAAQVAQTALVASDVHLMPQFDTPTHIGQFLEAVADRAMRHEITPATSAAATGAALAALRCLEVAHEADLLTREMNVLRERMSAGSSVGAGRPR